MGDMPPSDRYGRSRLYRWRQSSVMRLIRVEGIRQHDTPHVPQEYEFFNRIGRTRSSEFDPNRKSTNGRFRVTISLEHTAANRYGKLQFLAAAGAIQ